jgi:hypothetical protein
MRSSSAVVAVAGGECTTCDYGRFVWHLLWQCVFELDGRPLAGARECSPLLTQHEW